MKNEERDDRMIDAALARLPEWEPPPGFVTRVAALGAEEWEDWMPSLLKGMRIAAGVSLTAWFGAELLYAGLLSVAAPQHLVVLGWTVAGGALVLGWRAAMPSGSRA